MTVRELIKILKSWPDKDTEVLLSSDAEGNNIIALHEVAESMMNEHGDLMCHSDVDDDEDLSGTRPVLIIYPV